MAMPRFLSLIMGAALIFAASAAQAEIKKEWIEFGLKIFSGEFAKEVLKKL